MAEMIYESSLVATVCFVKEDDPAINLPRILVQASVILRVEPLAKQKVILWSILLPLNITEIHLSGLSVRAKSWEEVEKSNERD